MIIKKRLTYATIAFYFFCDGVEYAIVFPTIWAYLQQLGAKQENLLGLSVAAYSFSSMLIGPVIGRLFDKTKNAKMILVFMNLFEALGSFMYFAAMTPWFLVLSRFICGIGNSGGAAIIADISCSTEAKTRTAIISNLQACRQIGLLIGPAFNLALRQMNFHVGRFAVNKLTAPGIFMVILGIVLEIMYISMYHNLVDIATADRMNESLQTDYASCENDITQDSISNADNQHSVSLNNDELIDDHSVSRASSRVLVVNSILSKSELCNCPNAMMESAEEFIETVSVEVTLDHVSDSDGRRTAIESSAHDTEYKSENDYSFQFIRSNCLAIYKDEFLREEVVAILGLAFVSFFAQTSMETIVTPLSQKYFSFGDFENSMLFLFAGIEILFAFLLINVLSRKLEDRLLILAGAILMLISLIWFLLEVPRFPYKSWSSLPYFGMGVFINLLGISMLVACTISLYSKVISDDYQGFGHGLRRAMLSAGTILGPLWGGAAVHSPLLLFSVPLAAVALFLLLFIFSFSRMRVDVHEWRHNPSKASTSQTNERTPLLSNS